MTKFTDFKGYGYISNTHKRHQMTQPMSWEIGKKGSGWILIVPIGYKFDISVPRWLEWLVSPFDRRILLPAAIHDRLLELGFDAAFASSEFRRACRSLGVGAIFAWALFAATLLWTAIKRRKINDDLHPAA